jgi:hypothetical protein
VVPTATHDVAEGQLILLNVSPQVPASVTGTYADHDHVPPDSVPVVYAGALSPFEPTAMHVVDVGQLTLVKSPPGFVSTIATYGDIVQVSLAKVAVATMPELYSEVPTATHVVALGQAAPSKSVLRAGVGVTTFVGPNCKGATPPPGVPEGAGVTGLDGTEKVPVPIALMAAIVKV